jgi:acyl-CoA synthetase (AMP-forming)/AMP-acid ligase II
LNLVYDKAVNVGQRLSAMAAERGEAVAVVESLRRDRQPYRHCSFKELEEDSARIAAGLRMAGARPGMRLVLLVPPGIDFVALFFGLLKANAVTILIDPGLPRESLIDCLAEAEPDGFVAVPRAQAARVKLRRRFPKAQLNVTVGRRWYWGGPTLRRLRRAPAPHVPSHTDADDPAAIIYT